jgi:hypothetical protein
MVARFACTHVDEKDDDFFSSHSIMIYVCPFEVWGRKNCINFLFIMIKVHK